ncbi:MAG: outer membrane beta-barrel protein [Sulfurovum sp.]|nr:outer membrane beta-barrel protein [Sulfurovum sp.]
MRKKLFKTILLGSLVTCTYLSANLNDDGWYVGIDAGFINIGDDTIDITTYDSDGNKKNTQHYKDTTSLSYRFKIGYQHFNKNRIELLFKNEKIKTNVENVTINGFGINYEWGLTCLESGNILPYTLIGFDFGRAKFKKLDISNKTVDTFGLNFGLGIRYKINENFDTNIGYLHSNTAFGDFKNDKGDITAISQDKVNLGITYKFKK